MTVHDALFIQQLQAAFHAEAQEHLQAMSSCLLELEKATAGPAARPILEQIFREVHSLKGAARAVAFADIERVCQELENVFAGWKRLDGGAKPEEFDAVSQALDLLGSLAAHARQDTASGPAASDSAAVEAVLRTLREVSPAASPPRGAAGRSHRPASVEARPAGEPAAPSVAAPATPIESPVPSPPAPPPCAAIPVSSRAAAHETVRISAAKLDALLRQAEELLTWKLSSSQRVAELRHVQSALDAWEREWARLASRLAGAAAGHRAVRIRAAARSPRRPGGAAAGVRGLEPCLDQVAGRAAGVGGSIRGSRGPQYRRHRRPSAG